MGAYGKFPAAYNQLELVADRTGRAGRGHDGPTLDVASVSEFKVDDLPALGLPTRPINGSRGMLRESAAGGLRL